MNFASGGGGFLNSALSDSNNGNHGDLRLPFPRHFTCKGRGNGFSAGSTFGLPRDHWAAVVDLYARLPESSEPGSSSSLKQAHPGDSGERPSSGLESECEAQSCSK